MKIKQSFIKFIFLLMFCVFFSGCLRNTSNASRPESNAISPQVIKTEEKPPESSLVRSTHGAAETKEETSTDFQNLSWQLVDGSVSTLADLKGQVVVLDFWATYCPPCEEEIPHLVEISNKYNSQKLQVIGLHVGGIEDRANVADFVLKYKMKPPYALGYPDQDLIDSYLQGDDRIPQTLVFDRQGKLVQKFVGFNAEIKSNLDAAVQQALETQ